MSSVATAADKYVSPFLASLTADASKTVNYEVLKQETVTIADISETFAITLSDASAVLILNAFTVTDPDSLDGTDPSANVDVSFINTSDFQAMITHALMKAVNSSDVDISGYLFGSSVANVNNRVDDEIKRVFNNDNFPNILASYKNNPLSLTVNYNGGATNMGSAISGGDADLRRYFVTQLPTSNVRAYQVSASEDTLTDLNFLPLLKRDKLVFVWNATVNLTASSNTPTENSLGANPSAPVSVSPNVRSDKNSIGTTTFVAIS